ncbi:MAG: S9 family peptidase [Verrucomicrobiales bacterium]|nr:S9 family peptidase [Verrucomicrobiales bacterium]
MFIRILIINLSFLIINGSYLLFSEENENAGQLSIDRIFKDKEFSSKGFSARWSDDGKEYFYLKDAEGENKGKEIWAYNISDGKDKPLVKVANLVPSGSDKPIPIDGYSFSKDKAYVLIYTNSKRVWRSKTRGDYWVLDRGSSEIRKLGGDARASTLQFAKFSPDSNQVAYVRERNIYVEDLLDHSIKPITSDRSKGIINGTSDWVYEEELGLRDGFRWSPDSQAIAYWQFDERSVRKHTMVDNVSGLYPKLNSFAYPKVGQRNAICRVGVRYLNSKETVWVKSSDDLRNNYIAKMEWVQGAGGLVIQQLNRAQDKNTLLRVDPGSGKVDPILIEQDEAWVYASNEIYWKDNYNKFTWISDRDGWRHVYSYSSDGKNLKLITPGEFDVIKLLRMDNNEEHFYYIASPENPSQRYLYRVGKDGSGNERVTPDSEIKGTHNYNISPDGSHAIVSSSNAENPPVTKLVTLPDYKVIKVFEDNEKLKKKFNNLKKSPVEYFYVDIGDGHRLHSKCIKPPNFDPNKKYPLLVYVYGEPVGQVVRDSWGGSSHLWHLMLAQHGYIVMSFDNRGSASPRGRDWRKASNGKIGILPPKDQAAAVSKVLDERSYIDAKRVGSWGWSGGGSMSLNAIFKYPDLYKTAIAVASVPNQRHYDTIYQERYMGLPGENQKAYREGSPINFAHQLKGNLLIVHGALDDNCHYQTFEKLVDRLISHNKKFSMMTYPRGTHSIREGKNTTIHLYNLMTDFIKSSL